MEFASGAYFYERAYQSLKSKDKKEWKNWHKLLVKKVQKQ